MGVYFGIESARLKTSLERKLYYRNILGILREILEGE